jgi:hypothetical protein
MDDLVVGWYVCARAVAFRATDGTRWVATPTLDSTIPSEVVSRVGRRVGGSAYARSGEREDIRSVLSVGWARRPVR